MFAYTQVIYSGTATATGNSQSSPVITSYIKEANFYLNITAVSGANPTLDIDIQVYNSLTGVWHKLAEWTQKTSTGSDSGYLDYGLGAKIAIEYTIAGTNPSFTFSVYGEFKNA